MIRSGLTNVQKAGYLGYPHERDRNPRNAVERPFVSVGDTTVLHKSDFSDPMANTTVTPSPVLYNDIFAKRTTADERLYVLKQIQQGLNKIQKGLLGKDAEQVKGVPLPNQPGQIIPTPPFGNQPGGPPGGGGGGGPGGGNGGNGGAGDGGPPSGGAPTGEVGGQASSVPSAFPDLITESPTSEYYSADSGASLAAEELAQDVVANPPAPTPQSEEERATEEWLHMQHSPQWAQIEGRTFNSNITTPSSYSPIYPTVSPLDESLGAYGPNTTGIYAPRTASPRSAALNQIVIYPPMSLTSLSSRSDGHSFSAPTARSAETFEQTQVKYLNFLQNELAGRTYDEQYAYLLEMPLDQRVLIGQAAVAHPYHPIAREPVFQQNIALFSPGTRSASTPVVEGGTLIVPAPLDVGPSKTGSPITPSTKSSVATTISSNGVGPRSRKSSSAMLVDTPQKSSRSVRGTSSAMLVDSPLMTTIPKPKKFARRANAPAFINPRAPSKKDSEELGIYESKKYEKHARKPKYRNLPRTVRTQVLEDAILQKGLDVTRRPRQR